MGDRRAPVLVPPSVQRFQRTQEGRVRSMATPQPTYLTALPHPNNQAGTPFSRAPNIRFQQCEDVSQGGEEGEQ